MKTLNIVRAYIASKIYGVSFERAALLFIIVFVITNIIIALIIACYNVFMGNVYPSNF